MSVPRIPYTTKRLHTPFEESYALKIIGGIKMNTVRESVKTCPKMSKYSPKSWGSNPAGYYEAGCKACRNAGETCILKEKGLSVNSTQQK